VIHHAAHDLERDIYRVYVRPRAGGMPDYQQEVAPFKTERLLLFSGVAAPKLGLVMQDHIQQ
jgi:hypothetical protein